MRMFYLTDAARHCLAAARDEAARLGFNFVGTEHLLLGLLREAGPAVAPGLAPVLESGGRTLDELRAALEARVGHGPDAANGELDLPYTSRAKRALELAMDAARDARRPAVDVEHLLVGILAEGESTGARFLRAQGLELEPLRAWTRALPLSEAAHASVQRPAGWWARVADKVGRLKVRPKR